MPCVVQAAGDHAMIASVLEARGVVLSGLRHKIYRHDPNAGPRESVVLQPTDTQMEAMFDHLEADSSASRIQPDGLPYGFRGY